MAHGPTGAPPEVTGVDVVRVPDGRIAARYPFVDGSGEWPRMKLAESLEQPFGTKGPSVLLKRPGPQLQRHPTADHV